MTNVPSKDISSKDIPSIDVSSKDTSSIDISLITVSTNEADDLEKCLPSIFEEEHDFNIEVIVVDNASTDGTRDLLAQYPEVKVLTMTERKGYIENNNIALAEAQGRYLLTMNADVVLQPGTLKYMLDFMDQNPDAALGACRLMFEDGSLQLTCRRFPTPMTYLSRLPHFLGWIPGLKRFSNNSQSKRYVMGDYDHRETRTVDWVISAFFMMRRSVVEEIGPFARNLRQPFYLEDVDWCFRAHVAKYRVYYVPEVWATHFYRQSSVRGLNRLSFVHLANILIFFRNNGWSMLRGKHRRHPT
ncbi:MAG: glycosyltransferase family 2 protein [Acidobacteriota bacterium]